MGIGVEHNHMKMQQEAMRANALNGIKKVAPDGKRDKRYIAGILAGFLLLAIFTALLVIPSYI